MALFHCHHRSDVLDKRTQFDVIIPDSCEKENIPCLYLLHGLYDDYTMWQRQTGVERYANAHGIAVVMPDAGKSFYTDMKYGYKYFTYISDELVSYTRRIFRISDEREKTYVCGNSMGGYGAFKIAMSRPDVFGAAVSMSGALDVGSRNNASMWDPDAVSIWGEDGYGKISGSKNDLFFLVESAEKSGSELPRLLQICGTEDYLYAENVKFRDFMKGKPFNYSYTETSGGHDWAFWDRNLPAAMDFVCGK